MENEQEKIYLSNLPPEILLKIGQFATWKSRHALSFVNWRLHNIFAPTLNSAHSISIKGCENVEFYLLDFELDTETTVRREFKCLGGKRTEVRTVWSGTVDRVETISRILYTSPRPHVIKLFREILKNFKLQRIHIGIDTFIPLLSDYCGKSIDEIGISDSIRAMEQAIRLQPKSLTIFGRSELVREQRVEQIDLEKLPNLRKLHLYCSSISLDQFLASKIDTLVTSSDTIQILPSHVEQMCSAWKTGRANYKHIQMLSASTYSPFSAYYFPQPESPIWPGAGLENFLENEEEEEWIPGLFKAKLMNLRGEKAIVTKWDNEFCFFRIN
ncbi:unnamed protein product [Caenorhabditis angaria]|uniref:F-box domain-containing protein n=1 Tax=Caenorhabditis angaria TaxID=860376 RepID=A0A9P1MUG5_9PELO|nr:unnamed protein product [Caenorhabditis angaria]